MTSLETRTVRRDIRSDRWTAPAPARNTFVNLVAETLQQSVEADLLPFAPNPDGQALQPHTVLALVTYCYAVGIYGSQDIEHAMREDRLFGYLCRNQFPDWRMIRRFRRHNRDAIQRTLEKVLQRARELNLPLAGPHRAQPEREAASSTFAIAQEAEARIERAMWMDSMAMDDV